MNVAAGVKIEVIVSSVAYGPKTVPLYFERTTGIKALKIGSWINGSILFVDLGFYENHNFVRVGVTGVYFVLRIMKNMDQIVVSVDEGFSLGKWNYRAIPKVETWSYFSIIPFFFSIHCP